ncbi:Phospholipase B-like protein B [Tritrichomonas foetus]|uniref:Phospholipase B-like n=1 Tax=Tritrichomonas foetus TaxID=1144522 RepID=A0A1J4KNQ4_9EUKA|nr:Phospholipase B-like protein B [Tritrichomonas foetus]|eukprot:OHT12929.1 Phospholipase B-like protein B [Tritrichomonas foetus]
MNLLVFLFAQVFCETKTYIASCDIVNGVPVIIENVSKASTVWANFTDSLNETGWYQFHSHGTEGKDSKDIMRCTGALEGYLSAERINQHFNLIFDIQEWQRGEDYPPVTKNFLQQNLDFVRQAVEAYQDSEFWQTIGLILTQFDGLVQGYQLKFPEGHPNHMTEFDLWFLQSEGDMFDIAEIYPTDKQDIKGPTQNNIKSNFVNQHQAKSAKNLKGLLGKNTKSGKITPGEHCSGLIRILPDYSDLFFAHDAWSDYRELHGELKEYNIPIPEFKSHRITMSTRIGKISSFDDFYINDNGLFVLETTINNFNEELYEKVVPQSLFTWIRAVHATWTTDNGKDWTETFIKYNSGTYNNQYLVVDSKKFTPNEKPTNDLLWIIEQYPGIHMSKDVTEELLNDGFFPSFNTPWFEELYNLAGFPETVAEWGDDGNYWTYNTSARYYIFYRDVPRIKTFDDFKAFMRYNNWKRDIYSNGDPGQQILARYDQRPGILPHFPARYFGGLDAKCLRLSEAKQGLRMQFHARASPPFDEENGIPVFKFPPHEEYPHDGLPDEWAFNWTIFKSDLPDKCAGIESKKECIAIDGCGFCTFSGECLPGKKEGPLYEGEVCEAGWNIKQEDQSWATPVIVATCVIVVLFVTLVYGSHFYVQYRKRSQVLV